MLRLLSFSLLLTSVLVGVPFLNEATEPRPAPPQATANDDAPAAGDYAPYSVVLLADDRGHFTVEAVINGRAVAMIADTGASSVVLTDMDARRIGLNPGTLDYSVPVATANGTAHFARVMLSRVDVDGIVVRDVDAMVAQHGALSHNLLGMSFIGRLGRFSMQDHRLLLVE